MKVERINSENYTLFLDVVRMTHWGNLMLPDELVSDLWGGVVKEGEKVVGGWVGTLRGNKPVVKLLAKSVYFDSYPIFENDKLAEKYQLALIDAMREWARTDGIVMFKLTHWVRGTELPYLEVEKNATFLSLLPEKIDDMWDIVDKKHRNRFRKGEKNGVEVRAYYGEDAIAQLPIFQALREQTQQHAISRNAKASILLKSDKFFSDLIRHTDATLFIGWLGDRPATVVLMIASGDTAYYHMGGSDYELNRQVGSSAYVFWKIFEYYIARPDIKYLDMGGVPVNPEPDDPAYGVYAFKKCYGGEYMEFDMGMIPISKWKYAVLKFLLSQRKLLRLLSKNF